MTMTALQRRLNHLLNYNYKLDSINDFIDSIEQINTLYTDNELSEHIDTKTLNINYQAELYQIQQHELYNSTIESTLHQLTTFDHELYELMNLCHDITQQLQVNQDRYNQVIRSNHSLELQQSRLQHQQVILNEFISQYTIDNKHIQYIDMVYNNVVENGDITVVTNELFDIIQHVASIKQHCATQLQIQYAAVYYDIMDQLQQYNDKVYEIVYRYIQSTIKKVQSSDDISMLLIKSFNTLQSMPVYYTDCINELINVQRIVLVTRFINVLTKTNDNNRPIEVYAYDLFRYSSDMCAWCLQALQECKLLLIELLQHKDSNHHQQSTYNSKHDEYNRGNHTPAVDITDILSQISDSLIRVLQQRIEYSLNTATNTSIDSLYQTYHLLSFYTTTQLNTLLNSDCAYVNGCKQLCELSYNIFYSSLQSLVTKSIPNKSSMNSYDLSTPLYIQTIIQQLVALCDLYSNSVNNTSSNEFDKIVDIVIPPVLQSIGITHDNKLSHQHQFMLQINTLQYIIYCIKNYKFVSTQTLIDRLVQCIQQLTQHNIDTILNKCNMTQLLHTIQQHTTDHNTILSQQPNTSPHAVQQTLHSFYSQLYTNTNNVSTIPQCERIIHPQLRNYCRTLIVVGISNAYRTIYNVVNDDSHQYTDKSHLLQYSIHDIDILLELTPVQYDTVNSTNIQQYIIQLIDNDRDDMFGVAVSSRTQRMFGRQSSTGSNISSV